MHVYSFSGVHVIIILFKDPLLAAVKPAGGKPILVAGEEQHHPAQIKNYIKHVGLVLDSSKGKQ